MWSCTCRCRSTGSSQPSGAATRAGEWGGDHHNGVPIFALTRSDPAVRGLAHYVNDLESAVARAKEAAGDRDVMMHGGSSFQALLSAGLVDELAITLVPILLGRGKRLFDERPDASRLRLVRSVDGAGVLHLRYQALGLSERTAGA